MAQRILIIEDNPDHIEITSRILRKADGDYQPDAASSLEEGLKMISGAHYDVVLCDYRLRGSTAFEALRAIRDKGEDMPFVVVTAAGSEKVAVDLMKNGASDYIVKDHSYDDTLVMVIKNCIDQHTVKKEKQAAEVALRRSEEQYKSLVQTIPDIIYEVDTQGIFTFVSDAVQQLGYSPQEIRGKHIREVIHPDDYKNVSRALVLPKYAGKDVGAKHQPKLFDERRTGGRMTRNLEIRLLLKNKEAKASQYCYVEIHSLGKWDRDVNEKNKKLLGSIGIIRDITERKKVEQELRSSKNFIENVLEAAQAIITVLDKEARIISINRFAENLLGYSRQEVIGRNLFDVFFAPDEQEKAKEAFKGSLEGIRVRGRESAVLTKDKRALTISWHDEELRDEEGSILGIVNIGHDVTHRKEIEKMQRLAQLGRLVADMAHEVNNPLMVISGRAQLSLMEEIQSPDLKKNLNIIAEQCQRAKNIIQRLLLFSKPSKGELREVDINKSIEEVVSILENQFKLSSIEIKRDYSEGMPAVLIDEKQIQEVFMSLLNNACEALPKGGTIQIHTAQQAGRLQIDFTDTGVGMDKDILSKVFEPFFTTKEKGTGLGLPICYGIIQACQGDLRLKSSPGKGTTATVVLPFKPTKEDG